jgi:predicted RNase H-like nuclease
VTVILGVDAAWTLGNPSGVALLAETGGNRPRLLAAQPSYAAFIDGMAGDGPHAPPVIELLDAAEQRAGAPVDVVAVDMPLATAPFSARREADNAVSRAFGAAGCGTHSPNAVRPGAIAETYRRCLADRGVRLATAGHTEFPALVEVYPHAALLRLCGRPRRLPYKVARCGRYWPELSRAERKQRLLGIWAEIRERLGRVMEGVGSVLGAPDPALPLAALKAYEDTLDAVVCAWIGLCFARGQAEAFGDDSAAIWVPLPET